MSVPADIPGEKFTDDIRESAAPVEGADPSSDFYKFIRALTIAFEEVADLVYVDSEDEPGWSILLDVDRAPTKSLSFLGQFVGVSIPSGVDSDEARDRIRNREGFNRGTPAAMISAAQSTLTGTRYVELFERDGDAYDLTVVTWNTETPDAAATLAALISQKPAGIILTHDVRTPSNTYIDVDNGHGDYLTVAALNSDYDTLLDF